MKIYKVVILVLTMMLVPAGALATDYDIDGQTGILNISAGTHRVFDSNPTSVETIQIVCAQGVTLTIDDVNILNLGIGECALSFTGFGNQLILEGTSDITSGQNEPGIRVESTDGTELVITGNGDLSATGGEDSAGIGSGNGTSSGFIRIEGGYIDAHGTGRAAGIGAGNDGHGGTTIIAGGEANAYGSGTASAIGADRNGGIIGIDGGIVRAYGSPGGAGIGGGSRWNSGTITITGGTVYAEGGTNGAAIGSGREGSCGNIFITGGFVYARGDVTAQDVGNGFDSTGGTLIIDGPAELFLHNGASLSPSTSHIYEPSSTLGGSDVTGAITAYRLAGVDPAWEGATTGYFVMRPQAANPQTGNKSFNLWIIVILLSILIGLVLLFKLRNRVVTEK